MTTVERGQSCNSVGFSRVFLFSFLSFIFFLFYVASGVDVNFYWAHGIDRMGQLDGVDCVSVVQLLPCIHALYGIYEDRQF